MNQRTTAERVFEIFKELNQIPRPSHHEELVADYLCHFAERLHLSYRRDAQNCVVISKPATPGHEGAEPVVLLNHMDMVCVGMADPLRDSIVAYTEDGWMKARGTSLGADNGIGLSMALAVLESDDVVHGPLEVITTTNEEDGMSGAANLSEDFIRGRKVINLDSEDYDTITTGAAGACLQLHRIPVSRQQPRQGDSSWYRIRFEGGLGGHSGVDINKGRCSAVTESLFLLDYLDRHTDYDLAAINIGEANASIASKGEMVVVAYGSDAAFGNLQECMDQWVVEHYPQDSGMRCLIEACKPAETVISSKSVKALTTALKQVPQGVVRMSSTMKDTVETSNNIGRIVTEADNIMVSTHTRSFIDSEMERLSQQIADKFKAGGASSELVMSAPAWQEDQQSAFLQLTSDTFQDVLGWRPRMVAMHFVLEAGFFVAKYPGIQMASIGPRIVEPHSTSERLELKTVNDIWKVLLVLLCRLASLQ